MSVRPSSTVDRVKTRDSADVRRAIRLTPGGAAIPGFSSGEGSGSFCELTTGITPESARRAAAGTVTAVFHGALLHPGPFVAAARGLRGVHRVGEQPGGVGEVLLR